MQDQDAIELAVISEGIQKAQRLLEELQRVKAETEVSPPDLSPEQMAEGRKAMENAIKSAEKMLASLHAAAATHPSNDDQLPA